MIFESWHVLCDRNGARGDLDWDNYLQRILAIAVLKSGICGRKGSPDWPWLRSSDCQFWCDIAGVEQDWLLAQIEERHNVRAA